MRFYLDENVGVAIADQLQKRGITVLTVRDLAHLGDSDINHLNRATGMGYVLCTYDADYLMLAAQGIEHTGIVYAKPGRVTIGDWIRQLELIHTVYTAEDMRNRIEYL